MGRHKQGDGTPTGDWRARMTVRGGRVSHALATSGIALTAALGGVIGVLVAFVYMLSPGERGADNAAAANFIGGLVFMVPIGLAVGALIGVGAKFAARAWLLIPTAAERDAEQRSREREAALDTHGLRPSGPWATSYLACAASAASYRSIVDTLPAGAARSWAADIGGSLELELAEALRLAKLGESLAPEGPAPSPDTASSDTARKVADLLNEAERSFADTTDQLATVALDLRDDSDFVRVRAQLDMLANQAPKLRAADSP